MTREEPIGYFARPVWRFTWLTEEGVDYEQFVRGPLTYAYNLWAKHHQGVKVQTMILEKEEE